MEEDIIKIDKCLEVVDNWGNTEKYEGADLYKLLTTPEDWSDDLTFIGEYGSYDIDDLIGQKVQVGPYIFTVSK